ncbi:unnamed protein product [Paramecium octaurelia]|uniref:Uncharacterized protein n=1 Tax=Paramecium octaurelia TaxID=43137 RepID=A0A8S1WHJ6_PAROT|nr:unnamed protein product [Paramecium octaurelia]
MHVLSRLTKSKNWVNGQQSLNLLVTILNRGISKLIQFGKSKDLKYFKNLTQKLSNYITAKLSLQDQGKSDKNNQISSQQGILNLDIKPQNIMIPRRQIMDSECLIDQFGLSEMKICEKDPYWLIKICCSAISQQGIASLLYALAYLKINLNKTRRKLHWQKIQQKVFNQWILKGLELQKIKFMKQLWFPNSFFLILQLLIIDQYLNTFFNARLQLHRGIVQIQMNIINQISISSPKTFWLIFKNAMSQKIKNTSKEEKLSLVLVGDARAIIISDLIKAYTTIGMKFIKKKKTFILGQANLLDSIDKTNLTILLIVLK